MSDFYQHGQITTLHDLGTADLGKLEGALEKGSEEHPLGLILPVTASDMRAAPFGRIIEQLQEVSYIDTVLVVLGVAPEKTDYRETCEIVGSLGDRARVMWTDGPRVQELQGELEEAGFRLGSPGKGRSVWLAFGYLLADPRLSAFVLHDCDIVNYNRLLLARLCMPMVHSSLDFEFCKAFYARVTDRMHGRVVRLLVSPLLDAFISMIGPDRFLSYLKSFRYPLSGEFAVTANLARSNRIPSDWGLEVGTLAEVFRNTSIKRVCQVDLCLPYEHKHQSLSLEDRSKGLMKMATDILTSIFRTMASRGLVLENSHFRTLRSAYLRAAQDSIRKYHADALLNNLVYDRHMEEQAVEGFAERITAAGEVFAADPLGGESIPNWARVLAALPDFPKRLRAAVCADKTELSG